MSEKARKGIILAGGSGTRLYPSTFCISKQLIPVYDKPMIYYPLSVIMLAGIREILIISTPRDTPSFEELFGDGSKWGLKIKYKVQKKPEGIAQALIIAEEFLQGSPSMLILGDNIFYGSNLAKKLLKNNQNKIGASVFCYFINNPRRYGVVEFDKYNKVVGIEEKPINPKSNYAVTGLYFFDKNASKYAKQLKFSDRKELEITDLLNKYIDREELFIDKLGRGFAWLDTGTHESLLDAQLFIQTLEKRQGLKIGCIEEISFNNGWIKEDKLLDFSKLMKKNDYGKYLENLIVKR
tara:strand:- start:734 stop:1618 length:885 start_codon:yes stop_codon:yes gene_type:complete